jgi:hypothetical protein
MPSVELTAAYVPVVVEEGDAVAIPVTVPAGYETGTWAAVVYRDPRQSTVMATATVNVVGQVVTVSLTGSQTDGLVSAGATRFTGYWELTRTSAGSQRTWFKGPFIVDAERRATTTGTTAVTATISSGAVTATMAGLTLADVNAAIAGTSLADLDDVDSTAPTSGQALVWDGNSWGPDDVTGSGSMTGTEILAALAPVDGSGSGLDADTVDGVDSTAFVRDTGDETIAGTKTFSSAPVVPDGSWALAKLADIATARLLGRTTAGAGDVEELTAAAVKTLLAIAAGDVTGLGALATLSAVGSDQITDGSIVDGDINASAAVALSKLAAVADQRILGNVSGGSAPATALTAAELKTLLALAIADTTGLQAALDAKQASDSDLTAIAALAPSNDDVVQRKAGAWANRTIAQLVTDLQTAGLTGGSTSTFASDVVTDGDITLPNTSGSWGLLTGIPELAIDASEGDWVEVTVSALRSSVATGWLDVAVVTGATPTVARYLATRTSTPPAEGDPSFYPASAFITSSGPRGFFVEAGDLDSGQVRLRVAVDADGSGTLYASTTYPFYWSVQVTSAGTAGAGAKVLLIDDVGSLPAGTPAGTVVVVKA